MPTFVGKADMRWCTANACFWPKADICAREHGVTNHWGWRDNSGTDKQFDLHQCCRRRTRVPFRARQGCPPKRSLCSVTSRNSIKIDAIQETRVSYHCTLKCRARNSPEAGLKRWMIQGRAAYSSRWLLALFCLPQAWPNITGRSNCASKCPLSGNCLSFARIVDRLDADQRFLLRMVRNYLKRVGEGSWIWPQWAG